jgi:hypothetical protein
LVTSEYLPSLGNVTETAALAELIADAQQIALPRPRAGLVDLTAATPPVEIEIPETVAVLVDGYGDYGS